MCKTSELYTVYLCDWRHMNYCSFRTQSLLDLRESSSENTFIRLCEAMCSWLWNRGQLTCTNWIEKWRERGEHSLSRGKEEVRWEYNGAVVGWVRMQQCTVRGPAAGLAALRDFQEKLGLGGGLVALSSAALWFPLAVSELICELACRVGTAWSQCFWRKQATAYQGHYHNTVLTTTTTTIIISRVCWTTLTACLSLEDTALYSFTSLTQVLSHKQQHVWMGPLIHAFCFVTLIVTMKLVLPVDVTQHILQCRHTKHTV